MAVNLLIVFMQNKKLLCLTLLIAFITFLALNFMYKPWPQKSMNACEVCCSLVICVLVPAMTLRDGAIEGEQVGLQMSISVISHMENGIIILPGVVTVFWILMILKQFAFRRDRAVKHYQDAQRLRDLMLLATKNSNQELNSFITGLDDVDRRDIKSAMSVLYTQMLGLQPTKHILSQRIIPNAPEYRIAEDAEILQRLSNTTLDLGRNEMKSLHERALLQWVLEQLLLGVYPDEARMNHCSCHIKLRKVFNCLDIDSSGQIDAISFAVRGQDLAKLTSRAELEECFAIIDTDQSGEISREEFEAIFAGMVFEPGNPAAKRGRDAMMRFAVRSPGGEVHMERLHRKFTLPRRMIWMQRRWRNYDRNAYDKDRLLSAPKIKITSM